MEDIFVGQHLWSQNSKLKKWLIETISLCSPDNVHLCNGSEEEFHELVQKHPFTPLNTSKRPNSYYCRSNPEDVARVEESTFICSKLEENAGPTNNWKDPEEMKRILGPLFKGCMKGRTLYAIPFCMGPTSSPFSKIGVQVTDSPYVVCSMKIMTHMGASVLKDLDPNGDFVACIHSVGQPLEKGQSDASWPCNTLKYIVHFPEEDSIWSYGSGYGGNALLGKKSFALRIASKMAESQGWLAEHMLIIGITNPEGRKKYIAAAFPSQCGKTNLSMIRSTLPGWKVECVGDDIAWMRIGKDGKLYAVNPEAGFFGVAPGTSDSSNPYAMETISKNTLFTNVALTADNDVWWEGMTSEVPDGIIDWKGKPWDKKSPAAHPNSRFTVSTSQCPILDPHAQDPEGVPISAILFGGRRASTIPLIYESTSWAQGVFLGASVSSETTSAAKGEVGKLRHDPFAMLPFCGYHMGDYFSHWLDIGSKIDPEHRPMVFYVNWFRKDSKGEYLWPGFGENMRLLKWVFERSDSNAASIETPIGNIPTKESLDLSGLDVDYSSLFNIDRSEWLLEVKELEKYFSIFGSKMPEQLLRELTHLKENLSS
jgi:phosphoenolpyruvate carboxykinase (GTP)